MAMSQKLVTVVDGEKFGTGQGTAAQITFPIEASPFTSSWQMMHTFSLSPSSSPLAIKRRTPQNSGPRDQ